MSGETPGINPEEFKKIDPKELVEQEGPNKGAISDIELAMIGAEAEQRFRQTDTDEGWADHEGLDHMSQTVANRAESMVPNADADIKRSINRKVYNTFIDNQQKNEDESKAEKIMKKLDDM